MAKLTAVKVTLSTGKVVILRKMRISDSELAVQEVAPRANKDPNVMQFLMQKALIKNLLIEVDGKRLSAVDREDMDELFEVNEYTQLLQAVEKMSGGDEVGKPSFQIEVVSSGDKSHGSVDTPA